MKRKDIIGLRYAINGVKSAFRNERNFKIHLVIAVLVLVTAAILRFSAMEYAILFLVIGLVIVTELINTAIEVVVDLICEDILKDELKKSVYNEKAKLAKDIGAGAVLIAAFIACIIGAVLFIPKII